MSARICAVVAGLLGLTGVAAGAFGAHALRATLDPRSLEIWGTGASYQQLHAAVLLGVAVWALRAPSRTLRVAGLLFTTGIVIFSGALYTIALGGPRVLGAVAPIGGLCLMAGWATLAVAGWRARAS